MKGVSVGSHKGLKRSKKKDKEQSSAPHQVQQVFAVREAALFLRLSESTVRRLILKGAIRAVRTNGNQRGRILISRPALLEFLGDDDGGTPSVAV
jgi:excisionase family DNA binding protein